MLRNGHFISMNELPEDG